MEQSLYYCRWRNTESIRENGGVFFQYFHLWTCCSSMNWQTTLYYNIMLHLITTTVIQGTGVKNKQIEMFP